MITAEEELHLQDTIGSALRAFAGVSKALEYTDDTSTDYHMNHMLSGVIDSEIRKVFNSFPEGWEAEAFML